LYIFNFIYLFFFTLDLLFNFFINTFINASIYSIILLIFYMILQFIFHFYYTVAFFNFKQYIVLKKLFNIFFLNFIEKDLLSLYALVNIRTILHSNQQGCFRFPINYFLVVDPVYNYNTYGFCSQLYQSGQKKHQSRVFSLIRGPHVHNKSHKQFIFQ